MLNVGQIFERVSDYFSEDLPAETMMPGDFADLLANANIDTSVLDSLSVDQIADQLANSGNDLTDFTDAELSILIQHFTGKFEQ